MENVEREPNFSQSTKAFNFLLERLIKEHPDLAKPGTEIIFDSENGTDREATISTDQSETESHATNQPQTEP